jgi:hypothetical protein
VNVFLFRCCTPYLAQPGCSCSPCWSLSCLGSCPQRTPHVLQSSCTNVPKYLSTFLPLISEHTTIALPLAKHEQQFPLLFLMQYCSIQRTFYRRCRCGSNHSPTNLGAMDLSGPQATHVGGFLIFSDCLSKRCPAHETLFEILFIFFDEKLISMSRETDIFSGDTLLLTYLINTRELAALRKIHCGVDC